MPDLIITDKSITDWCSCVAESNHCGCGNKCGSLAGASADGNPEDHGINMDSIVTGNNTFGLSGVWSLVCRYDNVVCNNKSTFSQALWFLLGAELMIERMYTSRMNFWKIQKEEGMELQRLFEERFQVELEMAVSGINLDLKDGCLDCNETLIIKEARL